MRVFLLALGLIGFQFTSTAAGIPDRVLKCEPAKPLQTPEGTFDFVRILFHGNRAGSSETADFILESSSDSSKNVRHNCALSSTGGYYDFSAQVVSDKVNKRTFAYDTRAKYTVYKYKGKEEYRWSGDVPLRCTEESPDLYEKAQCVRGYARSTGFQLFACEVANAKKISAFTPDVFSKACSDVAGKETVCGGHLSSLCSVDPHPHLRENPYQGYNEAGALVSCSGDVGEVFSVGVDNYREQCRFLNGVSYRGCNKSGSLCSVKFDWPLKPATP